MNKILIEIQEIISININHNSNHSHEYLIYDYDKLDKINDDIMNFVKSNQPLIDCYINDDDQEWLTILGYEYYNYNSNCRKYKYLNIIDDGNVIDIRLSNDIVIRQYYDKKVKIIKVKDISIDAYDMASYNETSYKIIKKIK